MRATINFDVEVDQVEGTMAVLACSEEHNLRAAADLLSNYTVLDGSVLDAITEVLRLLDMSAAQLRQYQQMMLNFERSRFETIIPQAVPQSREPTNGSSAGMIFDNLDELREQLDTVKSFQSLLQQAQEKESDEDHQPKEG
tara:strand:- start:703 stop:1125 length:423 start_codon:yes stop_codon:yes gene_type:complete